MATLTKNQINHIEAKAREVLMRVYPSIDKLTIPIELDRVLALFELQLRRGSFTNPEVIGAFDRKAKSIFISETDSFARQKFTIAHEIGHYVLHEKLPKETFYRTQLYGGNGSLPIEETEANWFAASLLMPSEPFVLVWQQFKDPVVLASYFQVSSAAAEWRAKSLKL